MDGRGGGLVRWRGRGDQGNIAKLISSGHMKSNCCLLHTEKGM